MHVRNLGQRMPIHSALPNVTRGTNEWCALAHDLGYTYVEIAKYLKINKNTAQSRAKRHYYRLVKK